MINHRAEWERYRGRPCRAARMSFPEYLKERARAVAFAAFSHEARGLPVDAGAVAELEEIARELQAEVATDGRS